MTMAERAEYAEQLRRLRGGMDDAALTDAWAEGRRMTADQAVALALTG